MTYWIVLSSLRKTGAWSSTNGPELRPLFDRAVEVLQECVKIALYSKDKHHQLQNLFQRKELRLKGYL